MENAFRYFGGVTIRIVSDNLKAAVIQADWFDTQLNPKMIEFCKFYTTTLIPTKPATPRHKGKIEAGIKYVQDNALKGRTFSSLADLNKFLEHWRPHSSLKGNTPAETYFETLPKDIYQ